jgi:glycosyltransferase involved in cell wall biosynthesis
MKLLMVDDRIPRESLGAGYPRANALIHALLPACEALAFYPLVFPDEGVAAPYAELDRRVELLMQRGHPGLRATLAEFAARGFDVLWVSRPENMRVVNAALADLPGLRERFTVVYDAEALYAGRTVQLDNLRGCPPDAAAVEALFAEELGLAARADLLVSVSAAEAATFRARTGRQTLVLGFTSQPEPSAAPFSARRDFGFAGAIRPDNPNEDSVLWYAANAMYEVHARTDALLRVVGFIDSPWVETYHGDRLVLHGPVDSLKPFFEHVRVFIAPTRFAAGLPQKLIDAASAGVPIVGTSLLARSLGWSDGREMLVADDAAGFIEACVRAYHDATVWESLRAAALRSVRGGYGQAIFERQTAEIARAIAQIRDSRAAAVG